MEKKNEIWKKLSLKNFNSKFDYYVSSKGNFKSLLNENERLLRQKTIKSYRAVSIKSQNKTKTLFIHRLVAEYFGEKRPTRSNFVIHIDYDKKNNCAENLKVASKKDYLIYQDNNPSKLSIRERNRLTAGKRGMVLTKKKVIKLKKHLFKKKKKYTNKELAEKFEISEMTLYRIKRGELWFTVKSKEEQKNKKHKLYKKAKKKFKTVISSTNHEAA
jgi:hypothetical protein